ncbi:MAG: hypothetical protein JWM65_3583 [Sphingomonas bacterium]|jgi:hypothetical protein|nr:hypothetical protein [Sphingomonas bacterium]
MNSVEDTTQVNRRSLMAGGIVVAACATIGFPQTAIAEISGAPLDASAALDFSEAHISDYLIAL